MVQVTAKSQEAGFAHRLVLLGLVPLFNTLIAYHVEMEEKKKSGGAVVEMVKNDEQLSSLSMCPRRIMTS